MSLVRSISTLLRDTAVSHGFIFPTFIAGIAIGVAVVAAVLLGRDDGIDGVNGFVELLSGSSTSFLGGLVGASFLFAFAAGMASAVNPCGFAMLPAYLGLFLGTNDQEAEQVNPVQHMVRALLIGGAVSAGFVLLFGVAGTVIALGASFVTGALPWLGLFVGILLAIAGAWLFCGGKLYTGIAARAASHIGDPTQVSTKGYFLFGLSYGTASLSCTLPIFLAVLGVSVAGTSILTSVCQFFLYALGMGWVIMIFTFGMAIFKSAMVGALRKTLPFVQPIGSSLMVIAGTYIIFYWLTLGDLL